MALDRKLSRWIVLAFIAVAIPWTSELASAADLARLQIVGIDGEGPADSIVLLAYSFAGPDGLQVTKQIDSTSPQLIQAAAAGTQIPSMALTGPGPGTTVFFDVRVTALSLAGTNEMVTFSYASQIQAPLSVGSATFGGHVTDVCTGKPIEGASIGLTPLDPSTPAPGGKTSSRTGVFKFTALTTGDYRLSVSDADHFSFEKVVSVVGARGQSESVALVPLTSAGCL